MTGLNLFNTTSSVPVFSCDIRHDVLVEELQNEGDAVGKDQMLSHVLKLRDKEKHLSQEGHLRILLLFVSRRQKTAERVFVTSGKPTW